MKHFAYIVIALFLISCHSTKNMSQTSASTSDSIIVNTDHAASSHDETLEKSLKLVLDSLDIWIYDYPFEAGQTLPDDTVYHPGSHRQKDTSKGMIHITAKRVTLDNNETTESHSTNDSLTTTVSTAHSENAESADTQSETTLVAKPPNLWWVLIVVAAAIIVLTIIYFKVDN